jgi:hypothetical protein
MIVVRYVTLAALVLWLAAMLQARFGDLIRHLPLLSLACGVVIFVGLLAMKFMGPPPPVFGPRVAIVFVMVAIAVSSAWLVSGARASMLVSVNIALGFLLLFWYTHE